MRFFGADKRDEPLTPDLVQTRLGSCYDEEDVSKCLIEWFGRDCDFRTGKEIAKAICEKAPWINVRLARTLVDIDGSLELTMYDPARVDREVLEANRDKAWKELGRLVRKEEQYLGNLAREDLPKHIEYRLQHLVLNGFTTDEMMATVTDLAQEYDVTDDWESIWRMILRHQGTGKRTLARLAECAEALGQIEALAAKPGSLKVKTVAGVVRQAADEKPELLLDFILQKAPLSKQALGLLAENWGELVTDLPQKALSAKDIIDQKFLTGLNKNSIKTMIGSPVKQMRLWGIEVAAAQEKERRESVPGKALAR